MHKVTTRQGREGKKMQGLNTRVKQISNAVKAGRVMTGSKTNRKQG